MRLCDNLHSCQASCREAWQTLKSLMAPSRMRNGARECSICEQLQSCQAHLGEAEQELSREGLLGNILHAMKHLRAQAVNLTKFCKG